MKIIISNKAKEHMRAHEKDFLIDWEELIKLCEKDVRVISLTKDFEIINIDFEFFVGYSKLVKVKEEDEILYAKRIGRENYTKFIKNANPTITNKVVLILKRNKKTCGEYYLVTIFPGSTNAKEPEDLNITNKKELIESLSFWKEHALIYDKDIIVKESLKNYCPYKNLYLGIA